MNYTTTQGLSFNISIVEDEIIYSDTNGDTLTWNNSPRNIKLVDSMVIELTTRIL